MRPPVEKRFLFVLAMCILAAVPRAMRSQPSAPLTAQEIFQRVEQYGPLRDAALLEYVNERKYRLLKEDGSPRSESGIRMTFRKGQGKEFTTVSQKGSGWVRRFVFQRLIDAEKEASLGRQKQDSSITARNYTFTLSGEETVRGHSCWVLDARPRIPAKYLFNGRVYVAKSDYGIVRVDGSPAKSLSFWVRKVHILRDYRKVGPFWLPLQDHTEAEIRIFGKHVLDIFYDSYRVSYGEMELPGIPDSHYPAGQAEEIQGSAQGESAPSPEEQKRPE